MLSEWWPQLDWQLLLRSERTGSDSETASQCKACGSGKHGKHGQAAGAASLAVIFSWASQLLVTTKIKTCRPPDRCKVITVTSSVLATLSPACDPLALLTRCVTLVLTNADRSLCSAPFVLPRSASSQPLAVPLLDWTTTTLGTSRDSKSDWYNQIIIRHRRWCRKTRLKTIHLQSTVTM